MLYAFFLVWVAVLLRIAVRFMSPLPAALTVIAAVAWSVPNYSAALPSWYNLFFASFALAALLRHAESGRRGWLWLAGACAGLSIAVKIVGLYMVAAALLWFVYREQDDRPQEPAGGHAFSLFVTAALALFLAAVLRLVRAAGLDGVVDFGLPVAALVALLLAREWRGPAGRFVPRLRRLLADAAPFLGGVAIPVVALLVPYLLAGSAGALLHGVFVLPSRRLDFAVQAVPDWTRPLAWAVLAVVAALAFARPPLVRRALAALVALVAAVVLLFAGREPVYRLVWGSAVQLLPFALTLAVLALWRWQRGPDGTAAHASGADPAAPNDQGVDAPARPVRGALFLLVATAATWSLVRYPFAGPLYFFYVAPLVIVSLGVLAAHVRPRFSRPLAGALAFYALFALLAIGSNSLLGIVLKRPLPETDDYIPPLPRAALRMTENEAAQYTRLVEAVDAHTDGSYIFATPDAPEVYFLTGRRNPTRTVFDFFDEPEGRADRVMSALAEADVDVVVTKQLIPFSGPVPAELERRLVAAYPYAEQLGIYVVRWRR